MTDTVERLRKLAEDLIALDLDIRLPPGSLNPHLAADEIEHLLTANEKLKAALRENAERMKADQDAIDRLRLSLSEALAQRDAAFEMSKCECGPDEACRNLVEARATGRREGMEEAARIARGAFRSNSMYDQNSPLYGSDLSPDRSEFGRGKDAGRSDAAAAIRAAMEKAE